MAMNRPSMIRRIDFAIMIISLVVIGTALGCLMVITSRYAAIEHDPNVHRYLARLSLIALLLLLFVVFVFCWMVMRYVFLRLRHRGQPRRPTPYVNAWALAGKRFKLSAEQERELDELDIEPPQPEDKGDQEEGEDQADSASS
ncbi:MAG: hypothetical protein ABSH10_09530 [Phycisphaerae bacterium]|jgi:glucan phosphoethanolaminetransferase (alkaline phosphatase superfamily)